MAVYGTVLRIFDETTLLAGIGARDGLRRGDVVAVVEAGEEIADPGTGESLGRLELVKAELVVADVQERMSILRTRPAAREAGEMPLSARMVRDSIPAGDRERMPVAGGEASGLPSVSPVQAGDRLRVVESVKDR